MIISPIINYPSFKRFRELFSMFHHHFVHFNRLCHTAGRWRLGSTFGHQSLAGAVSARGTAGRCWSLDIPKSSCFLMISRCHSWMFMADTGTHVYSAFITYMNYVSHRFATWGLSKILFPGQPSIAQPIA